MNSVTMLISLNVLLNIFCTYQTIVLWRNYNRAQKTVLSSIGLGTTVFGVLAALCLLWDTTFLILG